ncbi:unnamed protein product, partial [Scytosiphon promiscuus]
GSSGGSGGGREIAVENVVEDDSGLFEDMVPCGVFTAGPGSGRTTGGVPQASLPRPAQGVSKNRATRAWAAPEEDSAVVHARNGEPGGPREIGEELPAGEDARGGSEGSGWGRLSVPGCDALAMDGSCVGDVGDGVGPEGAGQTTTDARRGRREASSSTGGGSGSGSGGGGESDGSGSMPEAPSPQLCALETPPTSPAQLLQAGPPPPASPHPPTPSPQKRDASTHASTASSQPTRSPAR